jgi:WD40 repeat protein
MVKPASHEARPKLVIHAVSPAHAGAVAFSPNGRLLATRQADGTLALWSLETRQMERRLETGGWSTAVFSPDGATLALDGLRGLELWDFAAGTLNRVVPLSEPLGFTAVGELAGVDLALGGGEGEAGIVLVDPRAGTELCKMPFGFQIDSFPLALAYSLDGTTAAFAYHPRGEETYVTQV